MLKAAGLVLFLAMFAPEAIPNTTEKPHAEYTFARVDFTMSTRGYFSVNQEGQVPWKHDYPYSEDFFLTMVSQATGVHSSPDAYEIVKLESPDIFRYPFLYFSEPGFMELTDEEVENLREYFDRGGFALFDDFRGRDLLNLQLQMSLVYPEREMFRLTVDHPMFHTFYEIDTLDMPPPYIRGDAGAVEFWGMADEKDRLILVANHNNDFGEYWEDIDKGAAALRPSKQSFQFGVNYLIYAMTH